MIKKADFKNYPVLHLTLSFILTLAPFSWADGNKPTPTGTDGTRQPVIQVSSYTLPSQGSSTNLSQTSEQSLMKGGLSPTNTPSSSTSVSTPTRTAAETTTTTTTTSTSSSTSTSPWQSLMNRIAGYLYPNAKDPSKSRASEIETQLKKTQQRDRDKAPSQDDLSKAKASLQDVLREIGNIDAVIENTARESKFKPEAVQPLRDAYKNAFTSVKNAAIQQQTSLNKITTKGQLLNVQMQLFRQYESALEQFQNNLETYNRSVFEGIGTLVTAAKNYSVPPAQAAPPKQNAPSAANAQSSKGTWERVKEFFVGSETPKKEGPVETRAASGLAALLKDEN